MTRPGVEYGAFLDTPLARLAAKQHGVVALRQLRELGLTRSSIRRRREAGRLFGVHRGVYAVGHPRITQRGRWMAAVLACGEPAALSHHHAAALHGLRRAPYEPIHVVASSKRDVPGITCHVSRGLHGRSVAVVDGIPVTSVERVLLDMATVLGPQQLRSLLESAQRNGCYDHARVIAAIRCANGHRGVGALRAATATLHDEPPPTRSGLEDLGLEAIRAAGLPEPSVNVSVAGEVVDLSWPEFGLVVEIDSWRYHRARGAFESDRRRGNRLVLANATLLRYTDRQLHSEPGRVVDEIRQAIRRASAGAAASGR